MPLATLEHLPKRMQPVLLLVPHSREPRSVVLLQVNVVAMLQLRLVLPKLLTPLERFNLHAEQDLL